MIQRSAMFMNVIWGARCGKTARRVLLGRRVQEAKRLGEGTGAESVSNSEAPRGLPLQGSSLPSSSICGPMLVMVSAVGDMIVVRYADDNVPRTYRRKEVRCCARDGGRSGAGRQGKLQPPQAATVKSRGERCGKAGITVRRFIEASEKPLMTCRKRISRCRNRRSRCPGTSLGAADCCPDGIRHGAA